MNEFIKIVGSGPTTLIVSNGEIRAIMKIVKSLKKYDVLIKSVTQTIRIETKKKMLDFLV